jgi:hypothetical protein
MDERNDYNTIPIESESWSLLQGEKLAERMQKANEKEFSRTHDLIMANLIPKEIAKDVDTMLNINNYRMKLWCDMFIEYKKQSHERTAAASYASKDLQMFDLQFNS